MTAPFEAEKWLSEKANEGNPHAAAIRAEMDRMRQQIIGLTSPEHEWEVLDVVTRHIRAIDKAQS